MSGTDARTGHRSGCQGSVGERLSLYLDGDLPASERQLMERHFEECAACAGVLDELREVVARAQMLDRPSVPERDLWPGIQDRLRPRAARRWWHWRQWASGPPPVAPSPARGFAWSTLRVAAAAGLVAACAGAVAWWMPVWKASRQLPTESAPVATAVGGTEIEDEDFDTIAGLRREVRTLLTADPKVVEVLEQNLSALDVAIAEYRDSLAAYPQDARLKDRLAKARLRKIELLRQTVATAAEGNN